MTLHDRCREFLDGMIDPGSFEPIADSDVEKLVAFVASEIGRAADERFEDTVPLCLYFGNEADRREFIDAVQMAKPGMISKRWPA